MSHKEDIEYEEKITKLFKVGELRFYIIDDVIEAKTEAGASIAQIGVKGSRETTRITHAIIVEDPRFGKLPYPVWVEAVKQTVMGTLDTYGSAPPASSVVVTASGSMYGGTVCKECGLPIPTGCARCPNCYPDLGPAP